MTHRKLLLCCLAWSALYAQAPEDDTKSPPPDKAALPAPPAPPAGPADGKAGPKAADSKKKNAAKSAVEAPPSVPLSRELLAAKSILGALGTAIDAASADNPSRDFSRFRKQQADLQSKLSPVVDAMEISRQASDLLATLYGPQTSTLAGPPAVEVKQQADAKPREAWQPWALAILVALLSPLICVAGFWLGARSAEHHLRSTLREAGLL